MCRMQLLKHFCPLSPTVDVFMHFAAYRWQCIGQDLVIILPKTQVMHFYILLNHYALKDGLAATQVVRTNLKVTVDSGILTSSILNCKLLLNCHLCLWKYFPCSAESEPICGLAHFILYRVKSIAEGFAGLRKQLFPDTPALFLCCLWLQRRYQNVTLFQEITETKNGII